MNWTKYRQELDKFYDEEDLKVSNEQYLASLNEIGIEVLR